MQIKELLALGKSIRWDNKLPLAQIIVRMGKVFWDICRRERNAPKDSWIHTDEELKKELWNIIFSTIRRCDELWYDPEECIQTAIDCQQKFQK
jgi:hypothetical protein